MSTDQMTLDHYFPANSYAWEMDIARAALHNARANAADVWRAKNRPTCDWTADYLNRNYAFWRSNALARIKRCRAAVVKTEARWQAMRRVA